MRTGGAKRRLLISNFLRTRSPGPITNNLLLVTSLLATPHPRLEHQIEMERQREKIKARAVVRMQNRYRMGLARKELKKRKRTRAAKKVQGIFRMLKARSCMIRLRRIYRTKSKIAIELQRWWRGAIVRWAKIKERREEILRGEKVVVLQAAARMWYHNHKYLAIKKSMAEEQNKPYWILIQRCNELVGRLGKVRGGRSEATS